jgi:nicotinamidase-related amidase
MPKASKKKEALFVIDMQVDFTTGSFARPCEEVQSLALTKRIAAEMQVFAKEGGLVILSKDYHPIDHCSFMKIGEAGPIPKDEAQCPVTKPWTELTPAQRVECHCRNTRGDSDLQDAGSHSSRYKNAFPPHCVQGTEGAALHPIIKDAVRQILKEPLAPKPVIVYKGFAPLYESFSAFPHSEKAIDKEERAKRSKRESHVTGGWAFTRYPQATAADIFEVTAADKTEMKQHLVLGGPDTMVSVNKILKDAGISDIYVTGLVFDYCVKETAMFALENKATSGIKTATVVSGLSAPAMDGKPGLLGPLATKAHIEKAAAEVKAAQVCLVHDLMGGRAWKPLVK